MNAETGREREEERGEKIAVFKYLIYRRVLKRHKSMSKEDEKREKKSIRFWNGFTQSNARMHPDPDQCKVLPSFTCLIFTSILWHDYNSPFRFFHFMAKQSHLIRNLFDFCCARQRPLTFLSHLNPKTFQSRIIWCKYKFPLSIKVISFSFAQQSADVS